MGKFAVSAVLLLTIFSVTKPALAAGQPTIFVAPFSSQATDSVLRSHTLGLPLILVERLEQDGALNVLSGPHILTRVQARLADKNGAVDFMRTAALAKSLGATHLVVGRVSGQSWQWQLTIDVFVNDGDQFKLVGSGTRQCVAPMKDGLQCIEAKVVSIRTIHLMLAQAMSDAFAKANLPISVGTFAGLVTPSTQNSWAYVNLARAYDRYFNVEDTASVKSKPVKKPDGKSKPVIERKTALGRAEYTVLVDPTYGQAQRFYAQLLLEAGKSEKARVHFERANKLMPSDIRTILALGELELIEGNAEVARGHLITALAKRPGDVVLRFNLGKAYLQLGQTAKALKELEAVRGAQPKFIPARRELAKLYAEAKRYRDAAGELDQIVESTPGDSEAAFQLGAFLRADDRAGEASAAYEKATMRFPNEPLFRKFAFDVKREQNAVEREDHDPYPSGKQLVRAVDDGKKFIDALERFRAEFQDAANDVVMLLRGKKVCDQDAPGSYALALSKAAVFRSYRQGAVIGQVDLIDLAFKNREDKALTPDRIALGNEVVQRGRTTERTEQEIDAVVEKVLPAVMARRKCPIDTAAIVMADIKDVRARNETRIVEMAKAATPTSSLPITPVIPLNATRSVRYTVNNAKGAHAVVLTLSGVQVATIASGKVADFEVRAGWYDMCLLPLDHPLRCGLKGTVRRIRLQENWTIFVRSNPKTDSSSNPQ